MYTNSMSFTLKLQIRNMATQLKLHVWNYALNVHEKIVNLQFIHGETLHCLSFDLFLNMHKKKYLEKNSKNTVGETYHLIQRGDIAWYCLFETCKTQVFPKSVKQLKQNF